MSGLTIKAKIANVIKKGAGFLFPKSLENQIINKGLPSPYSLSELSFYKT